MQSELADRLTTYLTDAHSIELQALARLRQAPELAGDAQLADAFRDHLTETEGHERLIRQLLEARRARPSRVQDAATAGGDRGSLLFARLDVDAPGTLFAHALADEGLELASYELLARVAREARAPVVVEAAERIGREERQMLVRLEGLVDRVFEASQGEHARYDPGELLPRYLADAHAIEEQAIELLERAPKLVDDPNLAAVFADHLAETRDHAELLEARLGALGAGGPNRLQDAVLRLGALDWGAFLRGQPDTAVKLAAFAFAFEQLEIGGYELLKRAARRAGDAETVSTVETILTQERAAADSIARSFDAAAAASLREAAVAS